MGMIRGIAGVLFVLLITGWKLYKFSLVRAELNENYSEPEYASSPRVPLAPSVRDQDVYVAQSCYMADPDIKGHLEVDDEKFRLAEKQGKIVTLPAGTQARIVKAEEEFSLILVTAGQHAGRSGWVEESLLGRAVPTAH